MSNNSQPPHITHSKKTAFHMEFGFRREAGVWQGRRVIRPNFYPLATDLRNWLLRKGRLTFSITSGPKTYTNPYTHDGSILSVNYAQVINDSAAFVQSTDQMDPTEAEIRHIRLYTENVLYSARICEAFIKQMLFCTGFPEGYYRGAALGALLSTECTACRDAKSTRHRISLVGSLAHRYHLCRFYEGCLSDHMRIANRRRDIEAAHSGVTKFNPTTTSEARRRLDLESREIAEDLIHMLRHLSDIEERMLAELHQMIQAATDICPLVNLFKESQPLSKTGNPSCISEVEEAA